MDSKQQIHLWYVVAAFLGLVLVQSWLSQASVTERIPYSAFLDHLESGKIASVTVRAEDIEGRYPDPVDGNTHFSTYIVPPDLTARLEQSGAEFDGTVQNTFLAAILSWVMPMILICALCSFFLRGAIDKQGLGGMMSIGKSRAQISVERDTGVTCEDVAGVDEAKAELKEIVDFLKEPKKYGWLAARIPKGVLLTGPAGTGKTLFARAIALKAGIPFFSISGSEFVEMFVRVGAARVRDLFDQARKAAPCIIFIDEPDALRRRRCIGGFGRRHDEKEQTLNQLPAGLHGFDPRESIMLLAAIHATPRGAEAVAMEDIVAAIESVVAGMERKGRLLNARERETVAWHELGHALAAAQLQGADQVQKVSIIPRTIGALGYTMTRPTEDRFLITRTELENRRALPMAGRAAEQVRFAELSTGAADDQVRATDIAHQIVTRFGMYEALGQAVLERGRGGYLGDDNVTLTPCDLAEATAREVDLAVRRLLKGARADLASGAEMLLERKTITPAGFPPRRPQEAVAA